MPPKRSSSRSTSVSRKTAARKASPSPRKTPTRSKSPARGRAAKPVTPLKSSPEATPPARRTRSKSRTTKVPPATAPAAPVRTKKTVTDTPLSTGNDFAAESSAYLSRLRARNALITKDKIIDTHYERLSRSPVFESSPKPATTNKRWIKAIPTFKFPRLSNTVDTVKAHFAKNWRFYVLLLTLAFMIWGYIVNELIIRKQLKSVGHTLSELYEEHRAKIQVLYEHIPAIVAERFAPAPPPEPQHVPAPPGPIPKPSA